MRNQYEDRTDLKIRFFLALVTIVGMVVLAGTYQGNLRGAATGPAPRVTAIRQVTNDGIRKTNLLADDSQLFVTELPASNRVIAHVSLPGSDRSLVSSSLKSMQALDLSPDQCKLLVSSKSTSGDSEFWTLPVAEGAPQRVGDLNGRDASWSADGKQLVFVKGSAVYVANAAGSESHKIYSASGSVFAPRFSPDGQRIRFTVSETELNTTSLWEVMRTDRMRTRYWQVAIPVDCVLWKLDRGREVLRFPGKPSPNTNTVVTILWALSDSGLSTEESYRLR